ncbi:hypothetical protein PROFUN_00786 [Planoprotostelium fungivorum]|uniref:Uncharacterized protein n=1 Tax=Planoprotostelium fungivorum TaxID=1890364 RepID=A0A2P6NZY8_9EUKA|nr:hypothetical protein PROFUN_00786 [Planoprotostelium fungivorum]
MHKLKYYAITLLALFQTVQSGLASLGSGSTRNMLGGGTTNNEFCSLDSTGNCQWPDYAKGLATIALPFIIIAVLCLVAIPVFIIGRYALGIFGGRHRAPGTWFFGHNSCCGKVNRSQYVDRPSRLDFDGIDRREGAGTIHYTSYSKVEVWGVRIALLALFIAVIVCMAVGLAGNSKVARGLDNTVDIVTVTLQELSGNITAAVNAVKDLPDTDAILSAENQLLGVATNATNVATDIRSARNSYAPARTAVTTVILILPAIFIAMAAVFAFFNLPRIVYTIFYITFIVSLLMWLFTAIYVAVAVMAADGCRTAGPFVSNLRSLPSDQVPDTAIDQFVACSNGAQFASYRNLALQSQTALRSSVCSAQSKICQSAGQTCSTTSCVSGDYQGTMDTVVNDISGNSATRKTFADCAQNCSNANLKTATAAVMTLIGYSEQYDAVYENNLLPVLNCSIVDPAIDGIVAEFCGDNSAGTDSLSGIFLALAIINVFVTTIVLMTYKRWRKDNAIITSNNEQFELKMPPPPAPYNPEYSPESQRFR